MVASRFVHMRGNYGKGNLGLGLIGFGNSIQDPALRRAWDCESFQKSY